MDYWEGVKNAGQETAPGIAPAQDNAVDAGQETPGEQRASLRTRKDLSNTSAQMQDVTTNFGTTNTIDPREMSDDEKQRRGDMLRNAYSVDVKKNIITSTPTLSARKAAEKWWDDNAGEPALYSTEVGEVEINRNSVESSLAHRYSQKKLDAITSLKEGFENAVYLGTMPDFTRQEGVMNHYFAYPIMYSVGQCRMPTRTVCMFTRCLSLME